VRDENYPRDLVFSRGDNYVERIWQPRTGEPIRKIEMSGEIDSLSTSLDGLSITWARTRPTTDGLRTPVVTATLNGKPAFSVRLEEAEREQPFAAVALHRLDPASPMPQAVITGYTGGAHCCMAAVFATADASGTWRTVAGQTLDGGGDWVEDVDGDGQPELVHADNSFLYAFSSYAGSVPPHRIVRLSGGVLKDVTQEPRYRSYLRQEVARMEHLGARRGDAIEINGYLAGWVAAKARIGQVDEAWAVMLRRHERGQERMYEACLVDLPAEATCPENKRRAIGFPEALRLHLAKAGYPVPR